MRFEGFNGMNQDDEPFLYVEKSRSLGVARAGVMDALDVRPVGHWRLRTRD